MHAEAPLGLSWGWRHHHGPCSSPVPSLPTGVSSSRGGVTCGGLTYGTTAGRQIASGPVATGGSITVLAPDSCVPCQPRASSFSCASSRSVRFA